MSAKLPHRFARFATIGPVQTSNFTCAEPNANEQKLCVFFWAKLPCDYSHNDELFRIKNVYEVSGEDVVRTSFFNEYPHDVHSCSCLHACQFATKPRQEKATFRFSFLLRWRSTGASVEIKYKFIPSC